MEGYNVKIVHTTKDLTARERVFVKDFTDAVQLDQATMESPVFIDVSYIAYLDVHNENSADKDYKKFVIVDKNGAKFVTGSKSFITSLEEIDEEMKDSGEEYQIKAYRMPSKNYKGKEFLTCSIV